MANNSTKANRSPNQTLNPDEEKYRHWFENDLTGDFIASVDGDILECNPSFAEIYGFQNPKKALKSKISNFNPDDWTELISRLKKENKIKDHEIWHTRPDGKQIHVIANLVGNFKDDKLVQVEGYIFDDTKRKNSEMLLKRSEERYRLWFKDDLTGDFIASVDGDILECNPSFAEIYGFDNCKMATDWNISQSNPFDWPYIVTRLKTERKIKNFQSWQRRHDGMRIHVIANVVGIFDESNELIQIKGYVFDDTERKNTEDELNRSKKQIKEILDSIKDGFIALNPYWNFIYVNHCAAGYFGIEPEDIIGQNLWERFPEFGNKFETVFRKAMENKEIQHFESHGWQSKEQFFDFSVYPSTEGITIYLRDITNEKSRNKNLKSS